MSRRNDVDLLGRTQLFAGLGTEVIEAIAAAATPLQIRASQALFRQGGEPANLHLLAQGRLKVAHTAGNGTALTIRFMEPGEVPGCVAAFRRISYPATATAVVDSRVLSWPIARWAELMEQHPSVTANALEMVGGRTEEMLLRLREFTTEPVERRIARALLRLLSQAGPPVGDTVELGFPLSRQDIAEMAGTTLHTVSRTLSEWERRGLVSSGRQRVVILNPKGLEKIGAGRDASQSSENLR
ncbi:Crp/Fnr family transcriptional regulator [Roseicella frigidaeris]|nr:Crp/Fnr family transcriptional regulator [Roseicella frigidaeris]